jgi:hypothetical protein
MAADRSVSVVVILIKENREEPVRITGPRGRDLNLETFEYKDKVVTTGLDDVNVLNYSYRDEPRKLAQTLTLLTFIPEVPSLNTGLDPIILTKFFVIFFSSSMRIVG